MNPQATAASAYKEATYESAPPLKLVHMMYEGALKFLDQAEKADPMRDPVFHRMLNKADAVVAELRLSLDHTQSPELAKKLTSLYLFVEEALLEAQVERDVTRLAEARQVLETLLDGWKKLEVDLAEAD